MTPPPACGCRPTNIGLDEKDNITTFEIEYCPTHLAAFEMLKMLKDIKFHLEIDLHQYPNIFIDELIKRASGGKNG